MKYSKVDGALYERKPLLDNVARAGIVTLIVGIAVVSFILAHPVS
jgi:hypothetical protein